MTISRRISILMVACLVSATMLAQQQSTSAAKNALEIYSDILRQLDINYVDTIDYLKLNEAAINYLLYQLDPYTVYYSKKNDDAYKLLSTGKYSGVGSRLLKVGDYTYFAELFENMPAHKAGIQAGDKILAIDGKNVEKKPIDDINKKLRGVAGEQITVRVERPGVQKHLEFLVTRQEIKLPAVAFSTIISTANGNVGYIAFTDFSLNSSDEFRRSLDALSQQKELSSLVIDLRDNGGGIVDEAVNILSNFLPKGTKVTQTKGKDPKHNFTYITHTEPQYLNLPLIVLVDNESASASEILAGTLQDLDRATIIGQHTYGKGLVQSTRPIANGGHIKLTTSKYYLPSGRCIQAFDYSGRRERGNLRRVPDSLTHEFRTAKGRIVRDGGGIKPDIEAADSISRYTVCYPLFRNNWFFKYAVHYRKTHPTLPSPEQFEVNDSIFNDFEQFLRDNNFTYESETQKAYRKMLKTAQLDKLSESTIELLRTIEDKLNDDLHTSLVNSRSDINQLLGTELMTSYYFNKGNRQYILRYDNVLKRAVEYIESESE